MATTKTTTTLLISLLLIACGKGGSKREAVKTAPAEAAVTRAIVRDVAVSQSHVCAVLATGQVACWGELQGVLEPLITKPQIMKGISGATAISEDDCVLRGDKPAMCWDNQGVVTEVPGTEGATKIVHHDWNPCFLLADGSVSCWEDREKKLRVMPGLSKLRSIDNWAYGEWCYVRETGAVECSGEHADDLGKTLPIYPDAIDVVRVEQSIACVLRQGGVMSCFGRAESGADKYPTRADQITDRCLRSGDAVSCYAWSESASEWTWQPRKLDGKATDLSCESNTCCAIVDDGDVACWGDNHNGRLADGLPGRVPPTKVDKLPPVARAFAGERMTMATTKDGALYAWGGFGNGPHVPTQIAAGPIDLLAVSTRGAVGVHERHVRIFAPDEKRWRSEALPELPADARAISFDDNANICAALVDGTLRCVRPVGETQKWQTVAGASDVMQLSAAGGSTCGVTKAGKVVCMLDDRGEYDDSPPPSRAITVPGIDNARRVEVPMAELADGTVVRFHLDEKKKWTVTPVPALAGIREIDTGGYGWSATCGLRDNRAVCWLGFGGGKDGLGLIARSSSVPSGLPAPVEGLGNVRYVTAGNSHVCAIDTSDSLWCWGDDRYGELGRGRVTVRDEAQRVVF